MLSQMINKLLVKPTAIPLLPPALINNVVDAHAILAPLIFDNLPQQLVRKYQILLLLVIITQTLITAQAFHKIRESTSVLRYEALGVVNL
jgi:hypothetical protein